MTSGSDGVREQIDHMYACVELVECALPEHEWLASLLHHAVFLFEQHRSHTSIVVRRSLQHIIPIPDVAAIIDSYLS
jgi:hypothetical protein